MVRRGEKMSSEDVRKEIKISETATLEVNNRKSPRDMFVSVISSSK